MLPLTIVSAEPDWRCMIGQGGKDDLLHTCVVPASVVGDRRQLTLRFRVVRPRQPGQRDKRTLAAMLDAVHVRPVDQLPSATLGPLPGPSPKDHRDRLRHVENRPPSADPEAFAMLHEMQRANVVTLGTMNGQGYVFFPTELATVHPGSEPGYLPRVISELRKRGILPLSWAVFNIQDVRDVDQYVIDDRFPQWTMKYIDDPAVEPRPATGMCLVSSPYIEHHAKMLQQAASLDLAGFFFDGFYYAGVPDRRRAGCVCEHCQKKFNKDTGLDLPDKVDWTDSTFRRWVRWRNERLLSVARHMQDKIHEVNPGATCTFNTNIWPFANKDWETAIPMWRIDGIGVSQHGYSARFHEKWLMLGFKGRIGRDMNPAHTDMWRAAGPQHTCGSGEPDWKWHELEMLTFLLAGPTYGITPWHSTIAGPVELSARVHTQAARREPYFSRRYVADVGVLVSQNTHDFYGHLPETENLADYRDGILGTWMVLTENHIPFEFIFDNQLESDTLSRYRTLVLPGAAALSDESVAQFRVWAEAGGHLVVTGPTGQYDEWGRFRQKPAEWFSGGSRRLGSGSVTVLDGRPALAYCRDHEAEPAKLLASSVREHPLPLSVQAPAWLVANMFVNPDDAGQRWIHLLNVSHLMPEGDSGFRGMNRPPSKPSPSGRGVGGPLVPVENVVLELRDGHPKQARLAIAGRELSIDADGRITVPELGLHDVVVVTLK